MDLITTTDFALMPIIQKLSVAELNVYSNSTLRVLEREYIKNYSELMRTELQTDFFLGMNKIFDGWDYRKEEDIMILFDGKKEIVKRDKIGWFKEDGRTQIKKVEDLIDYDLSFNDNGVKIIRRRRTRR